MTVLNRRTVLKCAVSVPLAVGASQWLLPGTASAYAWPRTLRSGMSGSDVRELQIRIAGYAADRAAQTYVALDGVFGSGTAAAVARFQRAYGLTADSVAGPNTRASSTPWKAAMARPLTSTSASSPPTTERASPVARVGSARPVCRRTSGS